MFVRVEVQQDGVAGCGTGERMPLSRVPDDAQRIGGVHAHQAFDAALRRRSTVTDSPLSGANWRATGSDTRASGNWAVNRSRG